MTSILSFVNKDVDAICFQSTGNYNLSGKAIVDHFHSIEIGNAYPNVLFNLGYKLKQTKTNIPYIVGALDENKKIFDLNFYDLKNKNYKCLILNCPVKNKVKQNLDFALLKRSITIIEDYINSFKLNKVVISSPKIDTIYNIFFV